MATKEELENAEKLAEAADRLAEAAEKIAASNQESAEANKASLQDKIEQLKIEKQKAALLEDEIRERTLAVELADAALEAALKEQAAGQQNAAVVEKLRKAHEDANAELRKREKILQEQAEEQERIKELAEEQKQIYKDGEKAIGGIGLALADAMGVMDKSVAAAAQLATNIFTTEEGMEGFKAGIQKTLNPMNLLKNLSLAVLSATVKMAGAYDEAQATFNATTGAAGKYNAAINQAALGAGHLGVGVTEATKSMGDLFQSFGNFQNLSTNQIATLSQNTAALEKLGIAGTTTAGNVDKLTRFLGVSAEEAMEQQVALAEFAGGIGVAPAKMAENYAKAGPLLVKYGKAGNDVFKNLARQAKATGIEMDALLGITEKFDTFEGAAEAAGKLNAVLGGNLLNSVDLLTASEDERIEMLKSAVTESGRSFDQLGRFEKQAIMAAAGISDLETAQRMFGEGSVEVTEEQKEFNKMVEESQTVMDKLKRAGMELAIELGPLVDEVSSLATEFIKFIQNNKELIKDFTKALPIVLGIVAAFKALSALMAAGKIVFGIIKMTAALILNTGAKILNWMMTKRLNKEEEKNNETRQKGNKITKGSIGSTLAFGAAMLMIGGAIFLAATGMAKFVQAFQGLSPDQTMAAVTGLIILAVTIGAFGLALFLMAPKLVGASVGLLAFGVSVLLVSAGVYVLATAFELFVNQLNKPGIDKLPMVAISMLGLAGAVGILAASLGAMILALPGVAVLGATLAGLAMNLALIKTDDLVALSNVMMGLAAIDAEKAISFKASMDGLGDAVDKIGDNEEAVKTALLPFLSQFTAAAAPALPRPAPAAPTTTASGGGNNNQPIQIVLKLNDREIGKIITDKISQVMDVKT